MNRKYTKNFKRNIINKYKEGMSPTRIINKFNIPKSTLYDWIKPTLDKHLKKEINILISDYNQLLKKHNELILEYNILKDCHCFSDDNAQVKLAAIEVNYGKYPVKTMCRILNVAPGTFNHYHKRQSYQTKTEIRFDELKKLIVEIYEKSEKRFGYIKITAKLNQQGILVSDKTVSKLMKELKIKALLKEKKPKLRLKANINTNLKNHVKKSFRRDNPNEVWVGDITNIYIKGNTYYLCVIIDLFSRKVIAYRIHYLAKSNLVINTLKDAFEYRGEPRGVIFHSDRGTQYTSNEFLELQKSLGITPSFSNTGNPYDNAVVESFFSHLKKEEINRNDYQNLEELKEAINKYMLFYNDYRPHETNGNLSPNEYEKLYYDKKR